MSPSFRLSTRRAPRRFQATLSLYALLKTVPISGTTPPSLCCQVFLSLCLWVLKLLRRGPLLLVPIPAPVFLTVSSNQPRRVVDSVGPITLLLSLALLAQWKQAASAKISPTKTLLREKTSATTDHCQVSRDTANAPPASTAPGPVPTSLGWREVQVQSGKGEQLNF